jgi:hypothetical protein
VRTRLAATNVTSTSHTGIEVTFVAEMASDSLPPSQPLTFRQRLQMANLRLKGTAQRAPLRSRFPRPVGHGRDFALERLTR